MAIDMVKIYAILIYQHKADNINSAFAKNKQKRRIGH